MRHTKTIVIEFVGIPGSGKTTIARSLIGELKDLGISTPSLNEIRRSLSFSKNKRAFLSFIFSLFKHASAYAFYFNAFRYLITKTPRRKENFLRTFVTLKTFALLNNIKNEKILILEEGVVQKCLSIDLNSIGSGLPPLLESCSFALNHQFEHHLFFLEIDPYTSTERVSSRGNKDHCRFDRFCKTEQFKLITIYKKRVDNTYHILKKNTHCHLVNSSHLPIHISSEILSKILGRHVHQR